MSNKINVLLVLLGLCSVLYSCEKSNLAENKETFRTEGEQVSNCIFMNARNSEAAIGSS